jgi:hypothetical protein
MRIMASETLIYEKNYMYLHLLTFQTPIFINNYCGYILLNNKKNIYNRFINIFL